jgi:hypothetical protein
MKPLIPFVLALSFLGCQAAEREKRQEWTLGCLTERVDANTQDIGKLVAEVNRISSGTLVQTVPNLPPKPASKEKGLLEKGVEMLGKVVQVASPYLPAPVGGVAIGILAILTGIFKRKQDAA